MPLTLPDPEQLDLFSHHATDVYEDDQKYDALQQAADLLFLATGVTEDPEDETTLRILSWALMEMAWKLLDTTENKTEINAPFNSERIGSYSYSKQAISAIKQGIATGVDWFDAVVKLLTKDDGNGVVWFATEQLFSQPYCETDSQDITVRDEYGW